MFLFNKFNKKNDVGEDKSLYERDNVRCVCTLNKYPNQACSIIFKSEYILLRYENGDIKIYYDNIESYGKIMNTKNGIKDAMDKKILTQHVLQSPGFLSNNFYTLNSNTDIFLYIKFKLNDNDTVHTFLAEYNNGVEEAIKTLDKNYHDFRGPFNKNNT